MIELYRTPRVVDATIPPDTGRGLARPFADRIRQPVFLAFGATDVSADPRHEAAGYPASSDITLVVIPEVAHMHNFADTRRQLWDRFLAWLAILTCLPETSTHDRDKYVN